jgi:hypothetical protein
MSKRAGKPRTGRSTAAPTAAEKRLAAQRAMAAATGAKTRRKRLLSVVLPVLLVLVVVGVLVIVKVATDKNKPAHTAAPAATSVTEAVTSVPATVLDAIGAGSGSGPRQKLTGAALTADGLPRVLYVGAEWCPYCAAERWSLAVALSRFGTLTNLGQTRSSADDVDPNTATLSFHGATYTSSTISFTGAEIQDGAHNSLDPIDAADQQLFTQIGGSAFPFIDIGGKYYFAVQYDPGLLAGKTQQQIAAALSDKSSAIAKAVDGSANILTAAICSATGGQPTSVCTASGVVAAQSKLADGG